MTIIIIIIIIILIVIMTKAIARVHPVSISLVIHGL